MARIKFDFKGIERVQRKLGVQAAERLQDEVDDTMANGIQDMAERSYFLAPVDTRELQVSILESVTKVDRFEYLYGSRMPYAQRQEYEHKSKAFYFRRSVLQGKPVIHATLEALVRGELR